MRVLRYSFQALAGDYLRAAIGLALFATIMVSAPGALYYASPFALVFALFVLRTLQRQLTQIEVTPERISLFFPRKVTFAWREVSSLQLNYYSTKRDRTGGWMQLTITATGEDGARRKIRVDSRLEEFETVARYAAEAARANQVALSAPTVANFQAMGVDLTALEAPKP